MPGRRGKDRKREASCAHRAAGTELKSPDLEPGRDSSSLGFRLTRYVQQIEI